MVANTLDYHIILAWRFFCNESEETMTLRSDCCLGQSLALDPVTRRGAGTSGQGSLRTRRVPLSPSGAALNALITARIASEIVKRGSPRRPCANPVTNSPIYLQAHPQYTQDVDVWKFWVTVELEMLKLSSYSTLHSPQTAVLNYIWNKVFENSSTS